MIVSNALAGCLGLVLFLMSAFEIDGISGIYVIGYNLMYAVSDLVLLVCSGFQLKAYIQSAFPGVSTIKISQTLAYASLCYIGRSLILLGLSITISIYPEIKDGNGGVYWAVNLVFFYVLTEVLFLGVILKVIIDQSQEELTIIQAHALSEMSSRMLDDSCSKTSSYAM